MGKEFNVNCRKLMYEVFGKKRNSKDIEKLLNGANINYIKSKVPNHNGEFLFIKESDVDIFINYLKLSKTEKYEKTCQVKYGVNNISQVQSIIDKKKETFNKRKDLHKKPPKRKTLSQRKLRELKILEMYHNQYNKDKLHSIKIKKDSILHKIFENHLKVNTRHLYALKKVNEPFKISALSEDNIIEGIEYVNEEHFIIGVQFHPEDLDNTEVLYNYFIKEILKRKK